MTLVFLILAALTIAGTAAAMGLRNPIHCILALTVGLVGLAGLFLRLGAQFVGFTQVIVYVGAVAILAVFAIMMTQGGRAGAEAQHRPLSGSILMSATVACSVFGVLVWAIDRSHIGRRAVPVQPEATVNQIGEALLRQFALPLELMGLLLTAALIGAVLVAMPERGTR
jgi:NADH-quinone oxidoreductase subunit J